MNVFEANLILQRFSSNAESTHGILLENHLNEWAFFCYVLEDQRQLKKVLNETRIPAGRYEIVLQLEVTKKTLEYRAKYPWFSNFLMIKNVVGFIGIYLHIGNDDNDTSGCLLVGDSVDNNSVGRGYLSRSTVCFKRLCKKYVPFLESGNKVFIDVRDESRLI